MTKPVNLYILSRINNEVNYRRAEMHASGQDKAKKTQIRKKYHFTSVEYVE